MLPAFDRNGYLPPGIHEDNWLEFKSRFGHNSHRRNLLDGLEAAIRNLNTAGCETVYINGSFVTEKELPGDYDGCWEVDGVDDDLLDPVFFDLTPPRSAQKQKYLGEMFPVSYVKKPNWWTFVEFFQSDRSGISKGIVKLDIGSLQ